MINDIMVQYAQSRPWIILQEGGENTYVSSAMPQKRNPGLMNNCRGDASDVVSEMTAVFTRVHNLVPGMVDGKSVAKNGRMTKAAVSMLERFLKVLNALRINPERALEELNSDWRIEQRLDGFSGNRRSFNARPRTAFPHRPSRRQPHGFLGTRQQCFAAGLPV